MTPTAIDFDQLPPDVQVSIKRREAVTQPIQDAIASLDLTWEIARGNLADLDGALRTWEGDKWRAIHHDGAAEHRYHRHLLRLFHNFLSSAVSAVWHAERIVGRLKHVAPDLSAGFARHKSELQSSNNYRLLRVLRDYAIHTGHHSTMLVLRGVETQSGETGLAGSVCFDVKVVLGHLDVEAKRAGGRKRRAIEQTRRNVGAMPENTEMREILEKYFAEAGDLLRWLRRELVDVSTAAYARPLADWAAPQRRNDGPA